MYYNGATPGTLPFRSHNPGILTFVNFAIILSFYTIYNNASLFSFNPSRPGDIYTSVNPVINV